MKVYCSKCEYYWTSKYCQNPDLVKTSSNPITDVLYADCYEWNKDNNCSFFKFTTKVY